MKKWSLFILGILVLVMGVLALIPGIDMGSEPVWHPWVKMVLGILAILISLRREPA
jgi:uncharacterized membrane protein HdeD (DUF308 family)